MAVFMLNICKFDGCGITFPTLADLILHIEDTHIDSDPAILEQKELQQPDCLPLSYVLKFFSNSSRRDSHILDLKHRLIQHANKNTARNNTPSVSDQDDDDFYTESENSNDSWTTSEEYSSEYILHYGSRFESSSPDFIHSDKPFACPVPGCKKRYKNINGIKYHSKNGHKKDGKVKKGFKCHCGKSYKTSQGLKNHASLRHIAYLSQNDNYSQTPTIKSTQNSDNLLNLVTKSEYKALDVARLKSFIENNKKHKKLVNNDELGIISPATSPDSSPNEKNFHPSNLGNLHDNCFVNNYDY